MKLVFDDASSFKRCVDAIAVLIDEAEFQVDKDKFALKATDPSQISMIDFELPASAFKEYTIKSPMRLGLDLDYFSQVMSRAKPKEELTLELDEKNSRLSVTFKGSSTRKFSVPLLDLTSNELPNPKIEFDAHIKLRAELLQDSLKDAALISTHFTFAVTDEKFCIKANSSKGELNNEISKKDSGLVELKVSEECKAMFPLDYFSDMLKASSSQDVIELDLKANAPLKLSYSVGPAKLVYFLAPRIDNA
ncbi:MAG: proliferating cell nuclear antigen (pcna) [Candidatus Diapherotrites archaeon]|nr:proliferating cell nuclear antigen (pcna) [Candidatus Diapherotrites archaeon]